MESSGNEARIPTRENCSQSRMPFSNVSQNSKGTWGAGTPFLDGRSSRGQGGPVPGSILEAVTYSDCVTVWDMVSLLQALL